MKERKEGQKERINKKNNNVKNKTENNNRRRIDCWKEAAWKEERNNRGTEE